MSVKSEAKEIEETGDTETEEQDAHEDDIEEVITNVRTRRKQLEEHGSAFTRLIGEIAVAHDPDTGVAKQVQTEMVEQLRTLVREDNEVTVKEIAIALWFELGRVEKIVSSNSASDGGDSDGAPGSTELDSQTNEEPSENTVADRMFQ